MFGIIRGEVKDSKTKKFITTAKVVCPPQVSARPASRVNKGIYFVFGPYGEYTLKASANGYYTKSKKIKISSPDPLKPVPLIRINLKPR